MTIKNPRGTTAQNDSHTGAEGSFTYDTTQKRPRIHDGTTAGGIPLSKQVELEAHKGSADHDGRYYRKSEFTDSATANTPVIRDNAGDIRSRLFRSTYTALNAAIAVIYTSTKTDGTDFMRPSTPAQVRSAMGLGALPAVTNATLQNGWVAPSSEYERAGYYKDNDGVVHLVGAANGTNKTGDTLFTLPTGFRPAKVIGLLAQSEGQPAPLLIEPNGKVTIIAPGGTGFIHGAYFRT